jgi:hypothetical protein
MATPQQQVDGYLGEGWYAEWMKMNAQTRNELDRFTVSKRRMNISVFSPIYHRVEEDLNILGGIAADYRRAIDLIEPVPEI